MTDTDRPSEELVALVGTIEDLKADIAADKAAGRGTKELEESLDDAEQELAGMRGEPHRDTFDELDLRGGWYGY